MKVVGYHISPNLISDSEDSVNNAPPWLDSLFRDKGECIKVFYHMDYSVACLLQTIRARLGLTDDALKELAETSNLRWEEYEFQYIPDIWFSIKDHNTRQWAGFSNASQYDDCRLAKKQDALDCAHKAQAIGERVYKVLESLGLHPRSLTSPVSAFNKEILSQMDLPTIDDMPDEAAFFAFKSIKGAWTEAFKIGHFEAYDYDVKSAYASELAKLINLRYGQWVQSKDYIDRAVYGYCHCFVAIDKDFSPIHHNNYTPIGEFEEYLTKAEMDFITKWDLGSYEIIDGWWWVPESVVPIPGIPPYKKQDTETHHPQHPLFNIVNRLYIAKAQAVDDFEDNIIKRVLAGLWGSMLSATDKGFGEFYNPVWATEVQTNTKLKVAEAILSENMQEHLISITTDGMTTDQPFHNLLLNGAMGSWKLAAHCPAIVVGSGQQALRDKPRTGQFALKYDWLKEQIERKPKAKEYKLRGTSPMTLTKAVMQNRLKDLGEIENISRRINVGIESKRNYRAEPSCGRDLWSGQYSSIPWDASFATKIEETVYANQ